MDSIFIKPKDKKELKYIIELMENVGANYRQVTKEAAEEFEMAMMIKDKTLSTSGIIRQESGISKMTLQKENILDQSERDIKDKLIVTELKIRTEEDEWLNQ
ncbi:MAG: hypothetical protein JXR07_03180 [Reichenbachiella sp.]